jgi:hypothetical protein
VDIKVTVKDNGKNNIFVERIYKRIYSDFCFGISIAMDRKVNWGELDFSISVSIEGYQIWIRDDKDNPGPTICIDFNCKNFGYIFRFEFDISFQRQTV